MASVMALKEMEIVMETYAMSYAKTQIEILCGFYDLDVNEAMEIITKKEEKLRN